MEKSFDSIQKAILIGDTVVAQQWTQDAIGAGVEANLILNEGLIPAMNEVGKLFEQGQYFLPDMLIAARAMKASLGLLRPLLIESDIPPVGKVVIGTVKGDLHDIGKNLVVMMLEGAGFGVLDLGTDVSPEQFIEAVEETKPDIVAMSALLSTTMVQFESTINAMREAGLTESVKVIIGGAPVTEAYASSVGADGFAPDASQAASLARRLLVDLVES